MFGAFVEGWRRVLRAPALAVWVLLALLLVSAPLGIKPGELLGGDLPTTLQSTLQVTAGHWFAETPALPQSPGTSVFYALLGFGRTLAAPYLLFWLFLSGGLLDRLARGRPVTTAHFFAVSGTFLLRFVRLGLLVAVAYFVLFRFFRPLQGRPALLVFLGGLALVTLIVDFAKVRAVVEDRRSMLSALLASMRFIRMHPIRTGGVFAMHLLLAAGVLQLWARVAPLPQNQWSMLALAIVFLFIMIVLKLAFFASEVALFQNELAHAGYAALPAPVWPDSPAVEAIQNFSERNRAGHARPAPTGEGYEHPDGSTW